MSTSLKLLVACHSGTFSGIDTYAEQIARTAATASHSVTLIALGAANAAALAERLGPAGVRVITGGQVEASGWRKTMRQWPGLAARELQLALRETLDDLGEKFDAAHLNHPMLASVARHHSGRIVVAAWFYPHSPRGRWKETWHHTGARLPRSAAMAFKGLSHFHNDEVGYRLSDCVVAPTDLLCQQLLSLGIKAETSAPPSGSPGEPAPSTSGGQALATSETTPASERVPRIIMCCGDLAHPRKNVKAGLEAVGLLRSEVELELIGRNASRLSEELRLLAKSVRVTTPGPLSSGEVKARFRQADILLLPSLYEEWGYVMAEAALEGARVVGFPVYPFRDVLTDPIGGCASDYTTIALAAELERTIRSPIDRSEVRAGAEARFGTEAAVHRLNPIWIGPAIADAVD
ncbi:MAG TPA: glycosyltransferase family 4 protein [Candidatus Acidoferrales bacterium]|nr:glycosyltransferase family 4 protein [Candidatus Acidoferrales bacterium]